MKRVKQVKEMKNIIKRIAAEVGIESMGIAPARELDGLPYLDSAIREGRIATMNWLARNPKGRCNPGTLLAGAQSVVCCAFAYGKDGFPPRGNEDGVRARYARGSDYHKFVHTKLEKFVSAIKEYSPRMRFKICCDTSPILEKALASRAGLGWIGKHTILVSEILGSWFVLGEIITDIELEPDEAGTNKCGLCRRCIEACPTKALVGNYKLDSRLCISYLTNTHKSAVSEGPYGCDVCQEACPYNSE